MKLLKQLMKKHFIILIALFSSLLASAQKTNDAEFDKRLNDYMRLNKELQFDELMNYTHPRIFKLASREQMVQILKQTFDNEHFSMSLDSIAVTNVSGNFKDNNVLYKKIEYWMDMKMTIKDTSATHNQNFIDQMKSGLEIGFPDGKVTFNEATGKFDVQTSAIMIAIKDNDATPWLFLGYQKNASLLNQLYSTEVIEHFKLL
jgi:hypothetical protein